MAQRNNYIWHKFPGFGYRKTTLKGNGERIYTYHFQRKSAKPSPKIIFQSHKTRRLCGYISIQKDLKDVSRWLIEYARIYEETKFRTLSTEELSSKDIILKGLFKAIIITYGRCFSKGDGRKLNLERKDVGFDPRWLPHHDYIIEMRNQYIAHAGVSSHEESRVVCPIIAVKNNNKKKQYVPGQVFTESYQIIGYDSFSFECTQLLGDLLAHVSEKIKELEVLVVQEVNKISPEQLRTLLKKNKNKKEIVYQF